MSTFLTLDGVMQAPGGPGEDDSGGFAHGGWPVSYWDERMGEVMDAALSQPFDLLLGHRTYQIFAAHWPRIEDKDGGKPFHEATKDVASRGRPALGWADSILIEGDAANAVTALKRSRGSELQVHGSGDLVQTLLRHGLVDEWRLWVFPLILGSGKWLFADGTMPAGLRLIDSTVSTTGVFMGTYHPAGGVVTGSFALD